MNKNELNKALERMERGEYTHTSIRAATIADCPALGMIAALATLKSIDCGTNGGDATIRALRYGLIADSKSAHAQSGDTFSDGADIAHTAALAIMDKLAEGYTLYVKECGGSVSPFDTPYNTADTYTARVTTADGTTEKQEKRRNAYGYGMKAARRYITEQDKRRGNKNIISLEQWQTTADGQSELERVVDVRAEYDFQNIADFDQWKQLIDSLHLSIREKEYARLIRKGYSNLQIASALGVVPARATALQKQVKEKYVAVYGNPYKSNDMPRICATHKPAENTTERRTTEQAVFAYVVKD